MLAITCGAAAIVAAASLVGRPSQAPARAPATSHLSAGADRLAVVDGDTLRVGDHVVRLEGIAAPSRGSVCHGDSSASIDCGAAAANALAALVRGNGVDCTISGHDGMGRPMGTCVAGGALLNQALVRGGWARAETAELREPEEAARTAGRGMWRAGS